VNPRLKRYRWIFLTFSLLVAGSSYAFSQKAVAPAPLRKRIPRADPGKYQNVLLSSDWKNPFLMVEPGGVEFINLGRPGNVVAVDSVPAVLEALPKSAWPYGLIVAVAEPGLRGVGDAAINANGKKLYQLLRSIGVPVFGWPSG
jgi:hypothetical protein